ncbi:FAD dependent oxidoreductase domain-containing protein [Sarocladium implicatum]|nr:FAD dependent oxidoreductase domain-containing protein [Sarocladium implicatum]
MFRSSFQALLALSSILSPTSALTIAPNSLNTREPAPKHRDGFPVPNPTESYWQDPPSRIANLRTTEDLPTDHLFDYVIIGSGISGAAVAYKLLNRDPDLSILMLEGRTAASGATGRNGGHCKAGSYKSIKKWIDAYGEDEGLRIAKMEQDCVDDLRDFVLSNNVSSSWQDVETADIYWTTEAFKAAIEVVEYQKELEKRRPDDAPQNERTIYAGDAAREKWQWPEILGAVVYRAHTQNPYHTVTAMLEFALAKGLNLQTNTMALSMSQKKAKSDKTTWEIKTERGTVKGKQAVLATNSYTNALHKGFASTNFIEPDRSQISVVHPSKDTSDNPVFRRSSSYPDLHSGNNYIAIRAPGDAGAGDVIIGGSTQFSPTREANLTDDSVINEDIASNLRKVGRVVYGHKNWGDDTKVLRDWTGITCTTPDGLPLVGGVPKEEGLWAIVCMNGHGMGWSFRSAEALVDLITEGETKDWFPKAFRSERAWEPIGEL